jgi:hypothetical protein
LFFFLLITVNETRPSQSNESVYRKVPQLWALFQVQKDSKKARCILCNNIVYSNAFNAKRHIENKHKDHYEKLKPLFCISPSTSKPQPKAVQNSNHTCLRVNLSKEQIIKSYIGLVTRSHLPLKIINSPDLKMLLDPLCKAVSTEIGKPFTINTANMRIQIQAVAGKFREKIRQEMENRLVSLKVDAPSSLQHSIFGVGAQYMIDGVLKSRILSMTALAGAQCSTGVNLPDKILNVLHNYNTDLKQVVSVICGNGANMILASKNLSDISWDDEEDPKPDPDQECNEVYVHLIQEYINEGSESNQLQIGTLQVDKCVAHTVQLCALDLMKVDKDKENEVLRYVLFCRNVVKFLNQQSSGFRIIFTEENLMMPCLDCATQWLSTYDMLYKLLQTRRYFSKMNHLIFEVADTGKHIPDENM